MTLTSLSSIHQRKLILWTSDSKGTLNKGLQPVMRGAPPFEVVSSFDQIPIQSEPCIILGMGKDALERFQREKLIPKGRTVTSLRGAAYPIFGPTHQFMVTYNPGIVDIDYGKYVDVLCDTKLAMRMAQTGKYEPDVGTYQWITNLTAFLKRVDELFVLTSRPVKVAFDLETTGFNPYGPDKYIVCLQLSCEEGTASAIHFPSQQAEAQWFSDMSHMLALQQILHSPKISLRGANLKFDLHWLHVRAHQSCSNFRFDTTAVGSLLDENRSNALNVHAKVYTAMGGYDDSFNAKIDKARMDLLVPDDRFLTYAAGDADACLRVSNHQQADLQQDKQLTNFYIKILHPALRAFEQIEQGGVLVDMEAYNELQSKLETDMARIVKDSQQILGGRLVIKHAKADAIGGLNLGKASLINDFMFSPAGLNLRPIMKTDKTGAPSTAKEHIEMFKDHPKAAPFVKLFLEYGDVSKTLSTYVIGFRKHIRSDGRFHPTYWLFAGDKDENEGGTNCMPAGELVLTDRGYLPVEQVKVGMSVISHEGQPRRVVDAMFNGVKPIIEVELANGLKLRTTENHQYLIEGQWVRADQLAEGMLAIVHSGAEAWEPIDGWEDHRVSSWGRVFNAKTQRMVTQYPKGKWGHLKVTLRRNGCQKRGSDLMDVAVHRLVAEAFHGLSKLEVRHLNRLAWDNTAGNLCWGTSTENKQDAINHGTMSRRSGDQAKLNEAAVQFIREQPVATRKSGLTNKQLAEKFGVCERLIRAVRSGKRWEPKSYAGKKVEFGQSAIVKITKLWERPTYGLEVEVDHSHVTAGIVTHNTGRLSCKDPAFQTIPKHTKWAKAIRRCFPAPDGMLVLENDYSQGELKLMACVANEPTMIEAYLNGMDLHSVTSGRFAGYSYEQMMSMKASDDKAQVAIFEATRQLGKAGNFGLIYGMGANGFRNYAEANYHVKLSMAEAEEFRDGFFNTYTELPKYHQQYKMFASKFGFVRNPLGRIRHLPLINSRRQEISSKAERQAINAPIQGALSDLMIWTIGLAHSRGYTKECPTFGNVHDAMYTYVPEDRAYEFAVRQTELMANLPFHEVDWEPQLQFTADGKLGKNMAELSDMAKWK